jgi:chorismate-pyruvate lyase
MTPPDLAKPPTVLPWAYPLDEFYAQAGVPLPAIEQIREEELPRPYRELLAHQHDMTPTLEKFHGDKIHIHALRRDQRNGYYFREVVLELDRDDTPVEFGAIKINLNLFTARARQLILGEREPLGHILADCEVVHSSRPKAYLKLEADELIGGALRVERGTFLFGRRNTLFDPQMQPLAEIVEILPPAAAGSLQS